jgi:uncharacterized protein (DUF697 family)
MLQKLKDLFSTRPRDTELHDRLEQLRQKTPVPVIWLYGKTQSGKTSLVRYLTGAEDTEIGQGFKPCTRFSRIYEFPTHEAPLLTFLDTRGVDEPGYDPQEDLGRFDPQAHVVVITVKALDHALENLLEHFRPIRKSRPQRPVVLALTCLHEAYPHQQHVLPYPFAEHEGNGRVAGAAPSPPTPLPLSTGGEGRTGASVPSPPYSGETGRGEGAGGVSSSPPTPLPLSTGGEWRTSASVPSPPYSGKRGRGEGAAPATLLRTLEEQRRRFEGLVDYVVPIDLTLPEDGFNDPTYGGTQLKQVLLQALPAAYRHTLLTLESAMQDLQDLYARHALPHILGYSSLAATAGAFPIPWVDLLIIPGIQTRMIYHLAEFYGQPLSGRRFLELASTLGLGLAFRQAVRELVKIIPVVGSVAGAALAAGSTLALGKAFCYYYSAVHQGHVPRPEELKHYYEEQLHLAERAWRKGGKESG